MCKTSQIKNPRTVRRLKIVPKGLSALALGLLCSLLANIASAQVACVNCPANGQAAGVAAGIFVTRTNGTIVLPGNPVGACEALVVHTDLGYKAAFPGGVVGAGYYGGTANVSAFSGASVVAESTANVTPAVLATTKIGPVAPAPNACADTDDLALNALTYTFTAADIAAGTVKFRLDYTGGTTLIVPCNLQASASAEFTVQIAPLPTCSILPGSTNICAGGTATFTASQTGTGPFTYCWRKGCPGAGGCLSTNSTLTITNAQASDSSCYTLTVTDTFGCTTTCQATLVVNPPPSCNFTPATAAICLGSSTNFTLAVSSGTAPYTVTLTGCTNATVTIQAQNGSISIPLSCGGISSTCTVTATITDSRGCVSSPCTATLVCQPCVPCIKVYKQVVCTDATGTNCVAFNPDLTTQKTATGVRTVDALGQEHCSAFCYRITVTNCSQTGIELRNLIVTDTNFPGGAVNLAGCFPTTLGVAGSTNSSASCEIRAVTLCADTENVVTATAVGVVASSGSLLENVTSRDTNNVDIVPFDITCDKEASTNGVDWASSIDVVSGTTTQVSYRVTVHNSSGLPLIATINDATFGCGIISVAIPAHGSVTTNLCTVAVTCPPGTNNIVNVSAIVDTSLTNICVYTVNGGGPVTDTTRCEASVNCTPPAACRVTGGGRQDDPLVCPSDVRYVTHGGQVGAPVGNQVCSIDTNLANFYLGNPCIHGRWTHVRHVQGGLEGNFHARFFDTLDCACLDTNLNPQTCQYGAGTMNHGICGDRSTGPLPRPAPANKIAFTGVGDWACPNGRREPRACLFRVDIEDRGEPGNAHALASNKKENRIPDRYRIRIWVLSDSELAQLQGRHASGDDQWLLNFRNAISACNGIDYQDGGVGCNTENTCSSSDSCTAGATGSTTITFPGGTPVRLPNIDDGGVLLHGNHQIHPAIKECDPFNPTGPGLAKP